MRINLEALVSTIFYNRPGSYFYSLLALLKFGMHLQMPHFKGEMIGIIYPKAFFFEVVIILYVGYFNFNW